jgi:hypothetical protein
MCNDDDCVVEFGVTVSPTSGVGVMASLGLGTTVDYVRGTVSRVVWETLCCVRKLKISVN